MAEELAAVRAEVAELRSRVEELKQRLEAEHPSGQVSEEVLLAISAAVAAYLGKRTRVRQVRRRRDPGWSRRGRYGIQHSHNPGLSGL
ncbi:MAG: hypothetical protein CSA58_12050 [Micrococcales bacterium]|nr:MAG: hypothetical protein CSB46_04820 [Micrococcales bacterium]PIE25953.1 MAG: hypothetical protein CSA58_12050 [Micrococcales bacterium]